MTDIAACGPHTKTVAFRFDEQQVIVYSRAFLHFQANHLNLYLVALGMAGLIHAAAIETWF